MAPTQTLGHTSPSIRHTMPKGGCQRRKAASHNTPTVCSAGTTPMKGNETFALGVPSSMRYGVSDRSIFQTEKERSTREEVCGRMSVRPAKGYTTAEPWIPTTAEHQTSRSGRRSLKTPDYPLLTPWSCISGQKMAGKSEISEDSRANCLGPKMRACIATSMCLPAHFL